jgi:S-DNA-T family DNA segregation ATPase FtsK/SpoIIIE
MSQAGAVAQLVGRWSDWRWPAPALRPFRIDTLPAEITEAELRVLAAERPAPRPHVGLLAVGGDELAPIEVDLARSGSFVVAGPRRSGRSNALLVLGRSLLTAGCSVLAFAPRSGPLRAVRHEPGVVGVFVGDEPPLAAVLDLINGIDGPLAVLVDDAMLLNTSPVAELLERIVTEGGEQGHVLVAAGIAEEMLRPMRGFVYQAVQARAGLLLCPERSTDGELVGLSLPRSSLFRHPPGRGVLVSGGRPAIVQVPLAASALAEG